MTTQHTANIHWAHKQQETQHNLTNRRYNLLRQGYCNPNRTNVFYDKVLREVEDLDFSILALLTPIVEKLGEKTVTYPLTVLYLPLKWCGVAFKYFEKHLGDKQYFPAAVDQLPENRTFAQFHAPQTKAMKEQILKELASPTSK